MIINKIGYSYNDLTIIPARITGIKSRSEVIPFEKNGKLPIFTAPMSTIVNIDNLNIWQKHNITPIVPRNIKLENRLEKIKLGHWVALSLDETVDLFIKDNFIGVAKICIDVANGHMSKLIDLCREIKKRYKDKITIMTGNIAHPEVLHLYEKAGIDYVRCSIGSGAGCITSPNVSIHYPIASLIDECRKIKEKCNMNIKIIADGGIRNYGDVIKALALGADYVMIGSLFAALYESAAEFKKIEGSNSTTTSYRNIYIDGKQYTINVFGIDKSEYNKNENILEELKQKVIENDSLNLRKEFYGMSTKKAQKLIDPDRKEYKTSEGTFKELKVKYTIKQWSENMEDYLRSAMSYCNAKNLDAFIGKQRLIVNSISEINSVNK